jgi:hypothetical protein
MVSVQARCTTDEALVLLNERAADTRQSLKEIALAVIERKMRFD